MLSVLSFCRPIIGFVATVSISKAFVADSSTSTGILSPSAEADRVSHLPGLSTGLESPTYAGFVDVDNSGNNSLYYIFFESFSVTLGAPETSRRSRPAAEEIVDPSAIPIFIWLNGGPGASSQVGNFLENGPYRLNSTDLSLAVNAYGWQNKAHVVYFDQPVGTGFSFTKNEAYPRTLEQVGSQFHAALQNWYRKFPALRPNPLYLSGESFAGAYIPVIAWTLHQRNVNAPLQTDFINLAGVLVGNPGNMRWQQYGFQPQFFRTHGLVSEAEFRHATTMYEECAELMTDAPGVADLCDDERDSAVENMIGDAGGDARQWEGNERNCVRDIVRGAL